MKALIPIGIPPRTQILRIERCMNCAWRIWLATRDFQHGTYLMLYDDGALEHVTERAGEGPDIMHVKRKDTP